MNEHEVCESNGQTEGVTFMNSIAENTRIRSQAKHRLYVSLGEPQSKKLDAAHGDCTLHELTADRLNTESDELLSRSGEDCGWAMAALREYTLDPPACIQATFVR